MTYDEIVDYLDDNEIDIDLLTRRLIAGMVLKQAVDGETPEDAYVRYSNAIFARVLEYLAAIGVPESDRRAIYSAIEYEVLQGRDIVEVYQRHIAPAMEAPKPPAVEAPTAPETSASESGLDQRAPVLVDETDEARVTMSAITAIDNRGGVYQRGGKFVEPQRIPAPPGGKGVTRAKDSWLIMEAKVARVRALATRACAFTKDTGKEDDEATECPDWLAASILASHDRWSFPVLAGIAEAPTMRPDGSIITQVGFDQETGIFLASDLKVDVPEHPTIFDAKRAADLLLDVVCDFPFSSEAGKSVWLSGVLSVVGRPAIDGPVPMHLVDASVRGSGKSKLVDAASIITTGRAAARMVNPPNDEEMEKRISALGLAGDSIVLIDNVVGELGGPSLDAALTSTLFQGRVLGKTEMTPRMTMTIVWWATGNGMTIGADLVRRSILARLEPQCEHPQERTGPLPGTTWRHPRLLRHIAQHRAELLGAALTLLRAYVVAGQPSQEQLTPMDFTAWSDLVRSAIVWCGLPDPAQTIKDVRAADVKDQAFRAAVEHWPVADGVEVTAAELIEWATVAWARFETGKEKAQFDAELPKRTAWRAALVEWVPPRRGDQLPTAQALGRALRSAKGAIVGAHKLEGGTHGKDGVPWRRTPLMGTAAQRAAG